jgi:hypothetical protein
MKEELLKLFKECVVLGKEGILQFYEFAKAQAPELVKDIFRWEFTLSFAGYMLALIILIVSVATFKKMLDKSNKEPYIIFNVVGIILSTIILLTNTIWLKILIAPRLFFVEYMKHLIK